MNKIDTNPTFGADFVAPAINNLDPLHLDGFCFSSRRGLLGVALSADGLKCIRSGHKPTHWLLPLHDIGLAPTAGDLTGTILWLSPRPPQEVAGFLVDEFRGCWLQGDRAFLNLEGPLRRGMLWHEIPADRQLAFLARIVVLDWMGLLQAASPNAVTSSSWTATGSQTLFAA